MMFPKRAPIVIKKIRDSARGEMCTFEFDGVCNHNTETTVLCHSNDAEDGKGKGQKADDIYAAYGCSACHAFYDGGYVHRGWSTDSVRAVFTRAMKRTWRRLIERGILQ